MSDMTLPTLSDLPSADPEAIGLDPAALERAIKILEREIAAGKTPGAILAIARRGKLGFAAALGNVRPGGAAMPLDAIFRIYSMTKPIVCVAAMQLLEEGRLLLNDPVAKYIPAFAEIRVGVERGGELERVQPKRPMTIQDLMRHTSGLTYGFTGTSKAQQLYLQSGVLSPHKTSAEHMETIARLPMQHHPGEVWEYSVSIDVLGRIARSSRAHRSARSWRNAFSRRSAWSTPPSIPRPKSSPAGRSPLRSPCSKRLRSTPTA